MVNRAYSMYNVVPEVGTLKRENSSYFAEPLESRVQRMMNNDEPITDTSPLIYTERKDGVLPAYDIRTDRFEIALDAMDKGTKSYIATREERHKPKEDKDKSTETQQVDKVAPEKKTP